MRASCSDFTIQFFNAFGEELLFRGVIFVLLLSLPVWRGIVLNGLLSGAMRYRTGSLWLCVILHMALNLCMIYSNVQGAAESTVFMVERGASLIEIALAAWVIFSARRTGTAPARGVEIGIGDGPEGRSPATPPGMRVRTGRFE